MSQSRKLVPEFGALSVGNTIFTEQFLEGSQGHVVGPASATTNAVARYSGTTGKLVKNSIVTLSDAGTLASSAGLTLSATGALALTGTSLTVSKGTVVQANSATTGVTLDTPSGQITTVSMTTAALTTQTFTVTNASVVPGSTVLCTLLYAGTFGTGGIPVVSVNNVTTGSFGVNVTNVHPTNALANFYITKTHSMSYSESDLSATKGKLKPASRQQPPVYNRNPMTAAMLASMATIEAEEGFQATLAKRRQGVHGSDDEEYSPTNDDNWDSPISPPVTRQQEQDLLEDVARFRQEEEQTGVPLTVNTRLRPQGKVKPVEQQSQTSARIEGAISSRRASQITNNLPSPPSPPQSMYPSISSRRASQFTDNLPPPPSPPPISEISQGAMSLSRGSRVIPSSQQRLYPDVSDEQWAQQTANLLPPPPVVDWTEQVQYRLDTLRGPRYVEEGIPSPPQPSVSAMSSRRASKVATPISDENWLLTQEQIQRLPPPSSLEWRRPLVASNQGLDASRRASQVVDLPVPPTATPQEQQRRPSVMSRETQVDIPFPSQQQYRGMPQGRPFTINVTTTPQMERFLASIESKLKRSPRRKSPRKRSAKKSPRKRSNKRSAKKSSKGYNSCSNC